MVVTWMLQAGVHTGSFQETRWPDTVAFPLPHGLWFASIGGEDATDGVAFVFSPKASKAL